MKATPFVAVAMEPQAAVTLRLLDKVGDGHGAGKPGQQMHMIGDVTNLDRGALEVVTNTREVGV